jgi:hypothetical protein
MTTPPTQPDGYVPVADLEIDAVTPGREGFRMQANGTDGAEYLVEMHLDMPIDGRTRAVLGEILSQSEFRVWRRPVESLRARWKRSPAGTSVPPS